MSDELAFDYIVVGGGSAGCVVASRLSESSKTTVALLEAGGEADSFWIKLPVGYSKLYDSPEYNWLYESEPEPGLNGGKSFQPRGKVLGGSGSINGNVYVRGLRSDFATWQSSGAHGWDYDDVVPYYRKAEDNERDLTTPQDARGPMKVARVQKDELSEAFLTAANEAGYPRLDYLDDQQIEGFGYNQVTIKNGKRCSTATAYLSEARRRPNVEVLTRCEVERVIFQDGAARGIEYRTNAGERCKIFARREVILCAGVFGSPEILQRSGIGNGCLLQSLQVPVIADLPGVGENLQDHIGVGLSFECARPVTINDVVNSRPKFLLAIAEYFLFRKGLLTSTPVASAGLIRTDASLDEPDVKLQLRNWNRSHSGRKKERMGLSPFSSFGVAVHLMHSESRGTVRIRGPYSDVRPEIKFNYFQAEKDWRAAINGQRAARTIMSMPSMRKYIVREMSPGPTCVTDEDLLGHFRSSAISNHHAVGTCKIGADAMAVVDSRLSLRGITGLRVVDASVMPRIVAANTNSTTIMIAEKGAAMIREDARSN